MPPPEFSFKNRIPAFHIPEQSTEKETLKAHKEMS
jgi:hypothetical protein